MDIEPYWGVIIGAAVGGIIKLIFFSRKKSRKAAASGKCPNCGADLVDKPFTTVTLRVCPNRHGYLSGGDEWVKAKFIKKVTEPFKDTAFEDLPQEYIIYWTMYHVLFSAGPLNTSRVDNVPGRKKKI